MNKTALRVLAGLSMIATSMIALPAQASLQGTLQRGQTQSLEVTLEPGQYILYVFATDPVTKAAAKASLSIYGTNGKLLRRSALMPPALQIPTRHGDMIDQGAAIEIQRSQTLRFEVRMETCRVMCGYGITSMRVDASGLNVVDLSSRVLPKKPSSKPSATNQPEPKRQNSQLASQPSPSNRPIYVFQTNSYVSTDLSVNPGDRIKIQASGRVRFGAFAGAGGPKGIAFSPEYNYFLNMAHGQLMVRIRRPGMGSLQGWTAIGDGGELIAKSSGILEFALNDNSPENNAGNFRIEVTIDPAR